QAAAIIAEAEAKAKAIRNEVLESAEKSVAELKNRKIAEADDVAERLGRLKLSEAKRKKIVKEIVRLILGA
ncbi:MAG: hypothetical protein QXF41_00640, partial [Candidatus Micrarchaeaceae archaeon]